MNGIHIPLISVLKFLQILKQWDLWTPLGSSWVLSQWYHWHFKQKFVHMYIFLGGGVIAFIRFSEGFLIPLKGRNLCPKELYVKTSCEIKCLQGIKTTMCVLPHTDQNGHLFLFFSFFNLLFRLCQVLVAACRLSCGLHVGSSSLTREWTWARCTGSTESYPLDHQGSPQNGHL